MGFPIHVDAISMGLSIFFYFKVLANSADPDGMCLCLKHEN